MEIYTVFEDYMFDGIQTQRALMSFTTGPAAQSYLNGLIENLRSKWKNMDDFDYDMATIYESDKFGLYVPMHKDKWHDYLTIHKSKVIGV